MGDSCSRTRTGLPSSFVLGALIAVAYGLLVAWKQLLFEGSILLETSQLLLGAIQNGKLAYMATSALSAFAVVPLFLSGDRRKTNNRVLLIAAVAMVAGPLVCLIPQTSAGQSFPYIASGLAIAGVGAAITIPLLAQLFFKIGPKATTLSALTCFLISSLLDEAICRCPSPVSIAMIVSLPIVSCWILRYLLNAGEDTNSSDQNEQWKNRRESSGYHIPVSLALLGAVLISGFLGSFVRGAMYYSSFDYTIIASDSGLIRAGFFAATIALLAVFGRGYDTFSIFWPWAAIPVVFASISLPFVAGENPIIVSTFFMAIQNLCSVFNMTIFVDIATRYGRNPVVLFCWGRAFDCVGCLLGFFLGSILASGFAVSLHLWFILSTVSALSIVLLIVLVAHSRRLVDLNIPSDGRPEEGTQLNPLVVDLQELHSFTSRENEIVALLNEGRSVPFIAQHLMVSPSTVRTHVQNIYRKLDVHNRQEFLDAVRSK